MTKSTVTENADAIVTAAMTETAACDETDGDKGDDRRWAEAVIASLPSRSREAQKALAQALLNGNASKAAPVGCAICENAQADLALGLLRTRTAPPAAAHVLKCIDGVFDHRGGLNVDQTFLDAS